MRKGRDVALPLPALCAAQVARCHALLLSAICSFFLLLIHSCFFKFSFSSCLPIVFYCSDLEMSSLIPHIVERMMVTSLPTLQRAGEKMIAVL